MSLFRRTRTFQDLLVLVFATLVIASRRTDAASHSQETLDVEECRRQGFDPMHLACTTCNLLPSTHQASCRGCCQAYKSVTVRTQPYEAAVLVRWTTNGGGSEVDELIQDKDEWPKFVKERGGSERLQILRRKSDDPMHGMMAMLMMGGGGPSPGEVLFLDQKIKKGRLSYETVSDMAKEVVSLQGLNKDEIRDMLQTLLPSQG